MPLKQLQQLSPEAGPQHTQRPQPTRPRRLRATLRCGAEDAGGQAALRGTQTGPDAAAAAEASSGCHLTACETIKNWQIRLQQLPPSRNSNLPVATPGL
jgi:hypothetical protein